LPIPGSLVTLPPLAPPSCSFTTRATSAMPLLDLPNELLRDKSEYLESEIYINAVAQANRHLYHLLDSYLYGYNVQQSGSSALLWAAERGQEATAQKSLKAKANIQATDEDDEAPLLLAVKKEHRQVVKLLVDKGAEVNAQGGFYGNALQAASSNSHGVVVKMLLDKGAEVNAQGRDYGNALQAASSNSHEAVVKMLLDKGAEANAQGGDYGNALQAASSNSHEAVVKMLMAWGAKSS
jgi:ankyrin repeat protein